jgi:hypothetical protein
MKGRVIEDTTNFVTIDYEDEILVGQRRYTVTGHEREFRFGIEDPKYWVKRAVDKETREKKIIKLAFFESFDITLGGVKIKRFRNPDKEGEILELVKDHPNFMHGRVYRDVKGNNVRILDVVAGSDFFTYVDSLNKGHEDYFRTVLPDILTRLIGAFEAIRFLHSNGFKHGDIREDHIIMERDTGNYVWIDFDYDHEATENPYALDLFGLGNVLLHAIGKGIHDRHMIMRHPSMYGNLGDILEPGDFSILDRSRFVNVKKMYPYVPTALNDILMHFSRSANVYYDFVEEIIEDLNEGINSIH